MLTVRRGALAATAAAGGLLASALPGPATAGSGHAAFTPGRSHASGDIDGDGRADRVRFRAPSFGTGHLTVVLANGRRITRTTSLITTEQAGIVRVAPIDSRPGADILVLEQHISTCNTYRLYGLRGRRLRVISSFCRKG